MGSSPSLDTWMPERAIAIAGALEAGGVGAFELTLNEPEADALRSARNGRASRRRATGPWRSAPGTILTIESAARAIDAGRHIPGHAARRHRTRDVGSGRGVPALPGCATPTEALTAWRAGADRDQVVPRFGRGTCIRARAPRSVSGNPGGADRWCGPRQRTIVHRGRRCRHRARKLADRRWRSRGRRRACSPDRGDGRVGPRQGARMTVAFEPDELIDALIAAQPAMCWRDGERRGSSGRPGGST